MLGRPPVVPPKSKHRVADAVTQPIEIEGRPPSRRFLLQVPAEIFVGSRPEALRGALIDLSMTGAFAILYESLPFNGNARVQFSCDDTWCRARGHVERSVPLARAVGLRIAFSGFDRSFAATLRDWSKDPFSDPARLARIRNVRIVLS
jgi:hypothetical protein